MTDAPARFTGWVVLRRWRREPLRSKKGWHVVFLTDTEEEAQVTGADNEFAEYVSRPVTVEVPR